MAGAQCLNEVERFAASHFADDDPVWTKPKAQCNKRLCRDTLVRVRQETYEIGHAKLQLHRVLDRDDALILRNLRGERIEKGCFTRRRAAGDKHILTSDDQFSDGSHQAIVFDVGVKELLVVVLLSCVHARESAHRDVIAETEVLVAVLANRHRVSVDRSWAHDDDTQPFVPRVNNPLRGARLGRLFNRRGERKNCAVERRLIQREVKAVHFAAPLDPDVVEVVHHDFCDVVGLEELP